MQHIRLVPEGWSTLWVEPEQRGVVESWNEMRVGLWSAKLGFRLCMEWDLGCGGSFWFWRFKASHFEIRNQLVGNFSEDRLSQSRLGSLERERRTERSDVSAQTMFKSVKTIHRNKEFEVFKNWQLWLPDFNHNK